MPVRKHCFSTITQSLSSQGKITNMWQKLRPSNEGPHQSVQSLSHVQLFVTPWTAARQASLTITNPQSLLKLTSIELVMPSNHLILYRPLLLLPSIFPSIRDFYNESVLHIRWSKYWSFSFSISPSNEEPHGPVQMLPVRQSTLIGLVGLGGQSPLPGTQAASDSLWAHLVLLFYQPHPNVDEALPRLRNCGWKNSMMFTYHQGSAKWHMWRPHRLPLPACLWGGNWGLGKPGPCLPVHCSPHVSAQTSSCFSF